MNYYESKVINSYYNKWYITSDEMGNLVTTDNKRTGNYTQGSQTITYLHADHLNTPHWATNASKQVAWSWQSEAYGATMTNEDPRNTGVKTNVPLRFPGQYFDAETDFH